ncbi:MAG: hydroxymethylpyrimidine/phosphomethylpyrimidine kinase [Rhodocyclales bacterium]|nr:hydroxymethylpyrimidine/phosphomethylpyrimidine kinase [Rhodocyclales bacterium]
MIPIPPSVLCFATTDPTGGGGLQADVLTIASMGCHPLAVVCAVAVRDTRGVEEVVALDPDTVADQARAVLEDVPVRAFKLGMVGSVENLAAIAEVLSDYPEVPLIVEASLFQRGQDDSEAEAYVEALVELAVPQATVLVAGRHDIARLDDCRDEDDRSGGDSDESVARLLGLGVDYVLVTGAAEPGAKVINVLFGAQGRIRTDTWERLPGRFLGARATLSSALAAALAHGMDVREAVREAQEFTCQALTGAYRPGMGLAVPDRLFWARDEGGVDD